MSGQTAVLAQPHRTLNEGTEGTLNKGTFLTDGGGPVGFGSPRSPCSPTTRRVVFTPEHIHELERRLGADDDGGFSCPLPDHDGRSYLGVSIDDPIGQETRLLCCRGRWRSLGEVRALVAYGAANTIRSNREIAVWTRLLGFELGAFEPMSVLLPALPDDAPRAGEATRRGFALLVGLRWADAPPGPVAFSVRFAAAWCGLTFGAANVGLRALREHAVITEVSRDQRTPLYLPGVPGETPAIEEAPAAQLVDMPTPGPFDPTGDWA
jgi:hypothetical protein